MNNEPFVLYRFRKIDKRLIESLVSQSLWFAKPNTLNDPFDCQIDVEGALKRAALADTGGRKDFLSSILSNPEFFETWRSTLDDLGVCCFSSENRDTRLWSHYADEHRGVCLKYQFRTSHFLTEKFRLTTMGPVQYLPEPLRKWLKDAPMDITKFVEGLVHTCLKTKSLAWAYEKEARVFRREQGLFNFSQPFLNQVCFGLRTPPTDIDLITSLAEKYSSCTMFSRMVRNETEFGFAEKSL